MIIFRKLNTAVDEIGDMREQICEATSQNKKLKEDLQFQMKLNAEKQHEKKFQQEKVYNLEFS